MKYAAVSVSHPAARLSSISGENRDSRFYAFYGILRRSCISKAGY